MTSQAQDPRRPRAHPWLAWLAVALWVVAFALLVVLFSLLVHAPGATRARAAYIALGAFCTFAIPALAATVVAVVLRVRLRHSLRHSLRHRRGPGQLS